MALASYARSSCAAEILMMFVLYLLHNLCSVSYTHLDVYKRQHVHLKDMGQLVAREIEAAGGIAKEFNTIAIDDGIAMGHDGMLYSLPSRDLIADSVEYMVNGLSLIHI